MDNRSKKGIYNIDYYSGSQVSIYIGDVLVDEVTSIQYQVQQTRTPLYGYADQYFRDVSKGQVLVQGSFTINFKEAGYLWLILNRYKALHGGKQFLNEVGLSAARQTYVERTVGSNIETSGGNYFTEANIERIVNGERSVFERNKAASAIASEIAEESRKLRGFSSSTRSRGHAGRAEHIFELFENKVFTDPEEGFDALHRRADEPELNGFDIYITFGDYNLSDLENHTVQKIENVIITGNRKVVTLAGNPVQEEYTFFARNII